MMKLLVAVLLFLAGTVATPQTASEPAALGPPSNAAMAQDTGPLVLFSRQVFTFRAANQGISPRDRAKRAHTRIHEQLKSPGPHLVTLKSDDTGIQVHINGATSFFVTPQDLDPSRERSLEETAQHAAASLTLAINESMESRSLETLLRDTGQASVATALYALVVWIIARVQRAFANRLIAITDKHSSALQVGGMTLFQRDRVTNAVQLLSTLIYRLIVLLLTVEWLSFVLRSFPYTRAWGESLSSFLIELVLPLFTSAAGAVPELLTALLIFYICYLINRALARFFDKVQDGQIQLQWIDADIAVPTQRIAKIVLWLFALAMAYPYLPGSDTEAFKGLSVLAGLMLSLGASSIVGQAASGLILTYGRVFSKGEFVRIAEHEGTVTEMGIFTTRIRTGLGEELTVSNASILASTTKNYSRAVKGAGFVLDTTVSIGYDTPWRQVHALLAEAASRTPGVLSDPAPQVFQISLSDFYPVYRLVCQAVPQEPGPRAQLLSNLLGNIQDVFNEFSVPILSPNYVEDPIPPKTVPPEKWFAAPAKKPSAT